MSLVAATAFAVAVLRGGRRQAVIGWWCAVLSIIETLIVEVVLNYFNPPYVDARMLRWTLLVLAASIAITAAWMVLDRPWRADNFDTSVGHSALAGS
jgi:hypothetical protein